MYIVRREEAAALRIQKHVRSWLSMRAYWRVLLAAVTIQSSIRGFSTRKRFMHGKKHRAATLIQVFFFIFFVWNKLQYARQLTVSLRLELFQIFYG